MRIPIEHAATGRRRQPERICQLSLLLILTLSSFGLSSCHSLRPSQKPEEIKSGGEVSFVAASDDVFKYCPVETIRQQSSQSGGIAALTAVMRYWEHPTDVEALAAKYPAESDKGYTLLQLRHIAMEEDLNVLALTMKDRPLDQVSEHLENGRPIIAPIRIPSNGYLGRSSVPQSSSDSDSEIRYVVIVGQSDDQFLLMDPAHGIVKLKKTEFTNYWSAEKNAALLCSSF